MGCSTCFSVEQVVMERRWAKRKKTGAATDLVSLSRLSCQGRFVFQNKKFCTLQFTNRDRATLGIKKLHFIHTGRKNLNDRPHLASQFAVVIQPTTQVPHQLSYRLLEMKP